MENRLFAYAHDDMVETLRRIGCPDKDQYKYTYPDAPAVYVVFGIATYDDSHPSFVSRTFEAAHPGHQPQRHAVVMVCSATPYPGHLKVVGFDHHDSLDDFTADLKRHTNMDPGLAELYSLLFENGLRAAVEPLHDRLRELNAS